MPGVAEKQSLDNCLFRERVSTLLHNPPPKARGPLSFRFSTFWAPSKEWLPDVAHSEKYSSKDMNQLGQVKNDSCPTNLI